MNKIKVLREAQGMTQEILAQKMKLDRTTLSKWETGEARPRLDNIILLAKIFNVKVDDLLEQEESTEEK